MNQKPIKDVEEERKDEGSGMDDFFAAVFFISAIWRYREVEGAAFAEFGLEPQPSCDPRRQLLGNVQAKTGTAMDASGIIFGLKELFKYFFLVRL